jgi:cytidylate kinase
MAIVTISRGSFAGGQAVAERLCARLGYPSLSREQVLLEAASDYGVSAAELTSSLNQSPPFWQQVPGKRLAYVKCVTAVLLGHARSGNLIYHGYVGHLLLSDLPQVLRVRVIADMEFRIKAAMERADLKRDQAVARIEKMDRERSRWARFLYAVEWDDPHQYDLVLNLGRLSADSACEAIARLSEQQEFSPTPEHQKRLEDASLSCRVWAALAHNPETRGVGIQVAATDGEVVISGSVRSTKAREAVARLAQGVEGVKSLQVELGTGSEWYW